ncbi:hypothetical protein [Brevundimonas faecalis]|uniref:Uncharacterized protein n=1 Tax=Brevundimonas faecalis TaxID=947378 RepID=A0ABV2R7X2_9CAUL
MSDDKKSEDVQAEDDPARAAMSSRHDTFVGSAVGFGSVGFNDRGVFTSADGASDANEEEGGREEGARPPEEVEEAASQARGESRLPEHTDARKIVAFAERPAREASAVAI